MMTTSPVGIELIKHFESFRAQSYQDSAGVWTIGYGTTRINGQRVTAGMSCTHEQALSWMALDVRQIAERPVNAVLAQRGAFVQQHEFDALVSFVYNVGEGNFATSTIYRKLIERQPTSAITRTNFISWNKVRDSRGILVVENGLTRRRMSEYTLFTTGLLNFFG